MIICPNKKNPEVAREFNELVQATSEQAAYHIWSLNNGNAIDKAPNGAESKLFLTLLEYYKGDRTKAIQAKAAVYGNSFLNWFGDWTGNATYEVYQGRTSELPDGRKYNYWSLYENEAKKYGSNVRKVRINPSGFLFKRELRWRTNLNGERVFDWGWSEEYEKVFAEFKEKTGYDYFDILENGKEGLAKQNEFFEFLESKGYKGYAEFNELELQGVEHDNPYTVTFGDNGVIDSDVSKVVDENGEPLIVWHGGAKDIRIFKHSDDSNTTTGSGYYTDPKTGEKIPFDSDNVMFFSSNRFVGTSYASLYGINYFKHLKALAEDILWNSNEDGIRYSLNYFKKGIDDFYEFLDQASEFNPRFTSLKKYIKKIKSENRRLTNKKEIEEIKKMVKELFHKLGNYTSEWLMNMSEHEYVYDRAIRLIDEYNNPDGIKRLINGEIPETIKKEWELYKKIEQYREKEGKSKIANYENLNITLGEGRYYLSYDGNELSLWTPDYSDPKVSDMTEELLSLFLTDAKSSAKYGILSLKNNEVYLRIKNKALEYPVFLNIKNPLVHDYDGTHQGQGYKESKKYPFGYVAARQVRKAMLSGNDGVIYLNLYDPYLADNYGVMTPNQIKSATGNIEIEQPNTGFSTTNDDIYLQENGRLLPTFPKEEEFYFVSDTDSSFYRKEGKPYFYLNEKEQNYFKNLIKNKETPKQFVLHKKITKYYNDEKNILKKEKYLTWVNLLFLKTNNNKKSTLYNIIDRDTGEIIQEKVRIIYDDTPAKERIISERNTIYGTKSFSEKRSVSFALYKQLPSKEKFKSIAKQYIYEAIKMIDSDLTINLDKVEELIDKFPESMWKYVNSSLFFTDHEIDAITTLKNTVNIPLTKLGLVKYVEKKYNIKILGQPFSFYSKKKGENSGFYKTFDVKNMYQFEVPKMLSVFLHRKGIFKETTSDENIKNFLRLHPNWTMEDIEAKLSDEFDDMYANDQRSQLRNWDWLLYDLLEEILNLYSDKIKEIILNKFKDKTIREGLSYLDYFFSGNFSWIDIAFNLAEDDDYLDAQHNNSENEAIIFNRIAAVLHEPMHALHALSYGTKEELDMRNAYQKLINTEFGDRLIKEVFPRGYHGKTDPEYIYKEFIAFFSQMLLFPRDWRYSPNLRSVDIAEFIDKISSLSDATKTYTIDVKENVSEISESVEKIKLNFLQKFYNFAVKALYKILPFTKSFIKLLEETKLVSKETVDKVFAYTPTEITERTKLPENIKLAKFEFFNALQELESAINTLMKIDDEKFHLDRTSDFFKKNRKFYQLQNTSIDNGESECDCSSASIITESTQIKQSLQNLNKQDNNFARPALIKHYIDKSRNDFILAQVDRYMTAAKNPTALDIYGVKLGSAIDWDELKIKLIVNEQQEKLAKVYGLKKQKRPDGTYIYVSSDKSKDTRLRIAFVNSMTGQDWVDEEGNTHKGLFYEGSKFEECAWNSIYISITDGDPTTFVHEMIHYYIRTFWDSQVVQDALRSIDDLKDRKRTNSEEDLQYSKKLEEKLVNTISESTMWNKNRSLIDKFWDGINNILKNIIGISLKNDKNASGNIIDTLNAAFSINQDLSDRKAETLYYYKYAGAVAQSQITPLLDQPDSFEGTTFWKIKQTLESRVKSEKSRGKSASEELLDFMQKLRRRSGFVKEDVYNTVIDFLLLAYGDVREAKNVLLDLKTKSSEELANADAGEIMHLRHDIISYYDKILVDVVDEYVNKNKDLSEEDIDFFKRHRTSLQKDINELKSQFNDILSAYVDVKIEQYGNELVSMGDKDIFIANMKLWARNAIDNGNLMPFENIIGTAVTSYSPIVRLVEYIVTAQNRITYTNSLEKGHELIDKYKKCASVKDKLLSINFMKQFCELDDDGNPTGYFVRKYNYGKLYKKRDDVIKKLVKKYNLLVDKDTGKINFEDKNLYVKYITDFYNELDKFVNFRYKKEYYIERAKILSPKAIELQQSIQSLINILLNKATDEELGVPFIFNLTSDEILTLEKLRKEKQNLSNPYIITYNSDGSISDIIEKTGEQLLIALEFIQWNAYKANKIKYKSNWDKFKEVKEKIKNKYGENSPELKLFERKHISRRISSQFYEDLNMPKTDDPRLIELYSRKSAIINSIKNKRGYYQPNLKKLNDQAFAELKRIDEEISNLSYSSYNAVEEEMGELQGKSKFNDIAVKRWVGEYKNGRLTTEPVINYFYNLERSRRLAQGIPQDLISDYTYISSDGKIRPLSVFKYTLPKSEDYLEYTLLNEFSELDPTSELLNQDFDVNENEEMQPKVRKDFLNETWQKIQNDENLKAFYDEILKTMHESYSMLPNMDADKMQYIMPQMRDRDAKLLFRNRHILNNMGASIADAFSITERETLYNEDFSKRPDGSYVETIPIRWITRLKDPTIISTDILLTVTMFYEMANNYRNKAEINPLLLMILFRTQGGFNTQAPGTEYSKLSQRIQNYLQMYVYGRTRTGISDPNKPMTERERKMSRMTETVLRVAHRKLMSHNWRAVLKNFVDSLLTDIAEIYTGKYITTDDSIFGVGLMGSEIINLLSSFGKANNKSLIAALMQLNGCSGTISEIFGLHNETWIRRVISKHASMGEYNFIDYTFKGHYVASLYHSIRLVKNPNTKKLEYLTKDQAMYHYQAAGLKMEDGLKAWKKAKITLINAYELDNKGNAVVKEKYKKYVYPHVESLGRSTNRLVNQVAGTIRERTSVINGILDQSNSVRAQQVTIGAMLLLMRGWMITQGWDNFKDGHDFGEYVEQWRIMQQSSQEAYNDVYMPGYINKKVNVDETKYTLVNEDPELRGQYNFETGSVEQGQWQDLNVASKNYMEDVILNLVIAYKHIRRIEDSAEYKKKLTRNQRYKLRRLSSMISTFIITAACTYFTTMLTIKWPKKWFLDLLSAANISVISERASQLPVFALFSILDIVNSIVISKTLIEDADKFVDLIMDIIEASKDHIVGNEDTKYNEKINTGAYAGLERWLRDLIKATSYTPYNVDNVFRSMTESGNKASINYYIHNVAPTKQSYEASRFFVPWALEKIGVDIEEPEWVKQSSKKKKKNSVAF